MRRPVTSSPSTDHLFLSDVHLGGFDPETNREIGRDLIALIEHCRQNGIRLYILGDLFDWWMEYPDRHPDPELFLGPVEGTNGRNPLAGTIRCYTEQIGPILYITGNHDNWTGGYFTRLGLDLEPEYREITLGGEVIFLHHGDGLSDRSLGLPRPMMHRFLRHPLFVRLYQKMLPPPVGWWIMKSFSRWRRTRDREDPERLDRWVRGFLKKNGFDFVICGHDHIPRMETTPYGTYINSGAFCLHRTAVLYTKGTFQLVTWNRHSRMLSGKRVDEDCR